MSFRAFTEQFTNYDQAIQVACSCPRLATRFFHTSGNVLNAKTVNFVVKKAMM